MSAGEILLILFIYLLLFGAKGLPSIAQTLGKAVYQFRNATKDVQEEIMKSANDIRKEATNNIRLDQIDVEDSRPSPRPVSQQKDQESPSEALESSRNDSTQTDNSSTS